MAFNWRGQQKKQQAQSAQSAANTAAQSSKDLYQQYEKRIDKIRAMRPGTILGEGSYGRVFLVESENAPKYQCPSLVVCKKVLGCVLDPEKERAKYVQNELKICEAIMQKPLRHIVKILKVTTNQRVVMEFGGLPLDEVLQFLPVSRDFVLVLLMSLTIATKQLLQIPLIHRDIAVRNILCKLNFSDDDRRRYLPEFVVCDLGMCSRNVEGTQGFKRASASVEDLMTWKTDIFCVGRVCFQVMRQAVSPALAQDQIPAKMGQLFGSDLVNVCENLMLLDPKMRPDHEQIIKWILAVQEGRHDDIDNFSHFILQPSESEKKAPSVPDEDLNGL